MAVIRQRWRSRPSMWRFSIATNIRHSCVLLVVVILINCVLVVFINLLSVFVDYDGTSSFESEPTIRSCVELENTLMGVPDSVSRVCQSRNGRLLSDAICLNLTCQNLIRASSSEDPIYSYAVSFMEFNDNTQNLRESDFISMTSDCRKFRKSRGFDRKSISDTEDFPIAFNIIVHRDIEQIERLIYALYRPYNQFCIHSDLKSSENFQRALFGIAECLPNVFSASERVRIIYAGFSRLQADIHCMKDHLERKHTWKYLINSAGQSYPLRTIKEIVDILRIYNGSNDIEGIYGKKVLKNRFEYQWFEWENSTRPVPSHRKNPKPPYDLEIIKGSAYGIFSLAFVEFAVTDPVAKDLLKWSEKTWSPDEHFWATLHHTYSNPHLYPPGGYAGNPNDKPWLAVYADWDKDTCRGKRVRDVCVFGVADLPVILSRMELFANKFHQDFQPLALECLRSWIEYKEICPSLDPDYSYYRSLPFIPSNFQNYTPRSSRRINHTV